MLFIKDAEAFTMRLARACSGMFTVVALLGACRSTNQVQYADETRDGAALPAWAQSNYPAQNRLAVRHPGMDGFQEPPYAPSPAQLPNPPTATATMPDPISAPAEDAPEGVRDDEPTSITPHQRMPQPEDRSARR
jgi:hypothetical protein